jgi:hypothetical protein
LSNRRTDQLHQNLAGGLPFPTPAGRKQPARPLRARKAALSPAQLKSESAHAQILVGWLGLWGRQFPRLLRTFHVANEHAGNGERKTGRDGKVYYSSASGARRKAEGVRPGMLDYYNLACSRGFSGLAIDLKVRDNDLSDEPDKPWDQVREFRFLRSERKSAHVCWTWAEAAALHAWYFGLTRRDLLLSVTGCEFWLIDKGGHDRRCGCDGEVNISQFLKEALNGGTGL